MAGLLSGLSKFGLHGLEEASVYGDDKAEKEKEDKQTEKKEVVLEEKDFLYDKIYECPVCSKKVPAKSVRSGKLHLVSNDRDLRAVYSGVDIHKYDSVVCPRCGFAALTRYFKPMLPGQVKLIKENICDKIKWEPGKGETYTYDEALERYQLCLACAVVKRAKNSEKAYICLKTAWAVRGYGEYLKQHNEEGTAEKIAELKESENEYLRHALDGFVTAKMNEDFPICGMDPMTYDLLLAELYRHFEEWTPASKLVSNILTAPAAPKRIKDRARDLKDEILAEMKKEKEA